MKHTVLAGRPPKETRKEEGGGTILYTTFRLAHKAKACQESYCKFAQSVGGVEKYGRDTPIPLTKIIEVLGLQDALWCLSVTTVDSSRFTRLLTCEFAGHVLGNFERWSPDDMCPRETIEVSRRFAGGLASSEELRSAAYSAAYSARSAVYSARCAVYSAAYSAAESAESAAYSAAASAAASAAESAAYSARRAAASAAESAAYSATESGAASAAYSAAESAWQTQRFLEMLGED